MNSRLALVSIATSAGLLAIAANAPPPASAASAATVSSSSLGTLGAGPQIPAGAVAVPAMFTATSRTYESETGVFTTTFYSEVVNVKTSTGAWQPIAGAAGSGGGAASPVRSAASVSPGLTQDCPVASNSQTTSLCNSTVDKVGWDGIDTDNSLVQFNIKSALPSSDVNVLNAQLGLYLAESSTKNWVSVSVYAVTKPWTTAATWNTYDGTHAWTTPGGDFRSNVPAAPTTAAARRNRARRLLFCDSNRRVIRATAPIALPKAQGEDFLHFHMLAFFGMPIGEMWNLEGLAADCAADKRYEFFLTSAPLNIPGGVGSPPNAIAVK